MRNYLKNIARALVGRTRQPKQSYSQYGEDLLVSRLWANLLNNSAPPFYMDVGAHDPVQLSNTFLFYEQGATGIAVEPNLAFAETFAQARPRDTLIRAGVGAEDSEAKFYQFEPPTLSTFSEEAASKYLESKNYRLQDTTTVSIRSISSIVDELNVTVDFLSLDVEGFELEVLAGIDFGRSRPSIICVEAIDHMTEQASDEVIQKLIDNDYLPVFDTYINRIFVEGDKWRNALRRRMTSLSS